VSTLESTSVVGSVSAQTEGWNQDTKLIIEDFLGPNSESGSPGDRFGSSVAVTDDGRGIVCGAPKYDSASQPAGSAFSFVSDDGSWNSGGQATTGNSELDYPGDEFGASVAVSNDGQTSVVGSPGDGFGDTEEEQEDGTRGSAYVYFPPSDSDGERQRQKLTADDGVDGDRFGEAVAISGDGSSIIIGSPGDLIDNESAGSAYIFTRQGNEWVQDTKLAKSPTGSTSFGSSVAISNDGNAAIIGDPDDRYNVDGSQASGRAQIYERNNGEWNTPVGGISADGDDQVGESVAIAGDGNTVLIGAPSSGDINGPSSGKVGVFTKENGNWSQDVTFLAAEDGDRDDFFGKSVAISGDGNTALIGASIDEDPNGQAAGSGYVFTLNNGEWSQQAKLAPSDGDRTDGFGGSVSLSDDGTTAVIGAPNDEDPYGEGAGSAYVFSRSVTSESVEIVEPSLTPSEVDGQQNPHTLSFVAQNVSADGTGEEFDDEFEVTFPEGVILNEYSNVDIEVDGESVFSEIEQNDNTLTFSVSPSGGGTTQVSVTMDVTLSLSNSK
jgi:hypothetical protein